MMQNATPPREDECIHLDVSWRDDLDNNVCERSTIEGIRKYSFSGNW